jgi:hypothetical protein
MRKNMDTFTRGRIIGTIGLSIAVITILFVSIALTLTGLNSVSSSDHYTGALQPSELPENEAQLTNARGYFCTEDGELPTTVETENGRYPIVDISRFYSETIDLTQYTESNTWIILSSGCMPITSSEAFITNSAGQNSWIPTWSIPSNEDIDTQWFTRIAKNGDVYLRSNPLMDYNPTQHSSLPTLAFLINSSTNPQTASINLYSFTAPNLTPIKMLLPHQNSD